MTQVHSDRRRHALICIRQLRQRTMPCAFNKKNALLPVLMKSQTPQPELNLNRAVMMMPNSMTQTTTNLDILIPLGDEKLSSLSQSSRQWIAQEFHDSIAQTLSSIMIFINYLDARLQHSDTQRALSRLNQLSQQLRTNFAYSRNSGVSLTEQVNTMLEELDTQISWIAQLPSHELHLTPKMQHELCNIIREGLHNINKHARANVVFLSISESNDRIQMTLNDNGQGFDNTELGPSNLGLKGIQERARCTGGYAKITSMPGKGTTIRVELKSPPQDDATGAQLNEICDQVTANLRQTFAYELNQLDCCIRHLTLCPSDKQQIKSARLMVGKMTDAVRQIIYTLRGTPASQIALEFTAPVV